jgi:hypothetical protein
MSSRVRAELARWTRQVADRLDPPPPSPPKIDDALIREIRRQIRFQGGNVHLVLGS